MRPSFRTAASPWRPPPGSPLTQSTAFLISSANQSPSIPRYRDPHANQAICSDVSSETECSVVDEFEDDVLSRSSFFEMHRQNIRALSLIVCTFTYLMIGAAVFDSLESEGDARRLKLIQLLEHKITKKYNISSEDYRVFELIVVKSIPHKAGHQWQFSGAFYFATLVITTVGYGHSTPTTPQGKAFCIFYALAGIPLNLVMFQSIGERLNTLICYVLRKIRRLLKVKSGEVSMTQMIAVSSTLGSFVIMLGTYLFNKYEHWGYFDSFYYCFITLTTIGFGDYVALQKHAALSHQHEYVAFSLIFILFGMAIFAAAVNLFVLRFMATTSDPTDDDCIDDKAVILMRMGATGARCSFDALDTPNGSVNTDPPALRARPSTALYTPSGKQVAVTYTERPGWRRSMRRCVECLGLLPWCGGVARPRYAVRSGPGPVAHLLYCRSSVVDQHRDRVNQRRHVRRPSL